mmetsp:Transcript_27638/g.69502  ORF Transcript_27638/g.69502 Transcript_27638/m.69502 type:complete len:207 (+) Transcript_27638:1029-1649(+)
MACSKSLMLTMFRPDWTFRPVVFAWSFRSRMMTWSASQPVDSRFEIPFFSKIACFRDRLDGSAFDGDVTSPLKHAFFLGASNSSSTYSGTAASPVVGRNEMNFLTHGPVEYSSFTLASSKNAVSKLLGTAPPSLAFPTLNFAAGPLLRQYTTVSAEPAGSPKNMSSAVSCAPKSCMKCGMWSRGTLGETSTWGARGPEDSGSAEEG